ncbi:MAG TPA: tryptophan synthase subunit alpha [Gemmatimonadaceae bacterium]
MASASATTSSDAIARRFTALRERGRRALVPYLTAGHPDPVRSLETLRAVEEAGADILEVGVPFSDPMADGPVIQASSQIALAAGMTLDRTLDLVSRAGLSIPVVLFSYLNPVLHAGEGLLERAAQAGVHGLLVTDLPVGGDPALESRLSAGPLAFVRLVAPTTPRERMAEIARHGSGFVYLISRLGVTGARTELPPELPRTVSLLREVCDLPICVGFGISAPDQARAVARMADGVVVGSALVRAAEDGPEAAATLVRSLRAAMDEVAP